jgi:ATP-dependent helicase/nuclease subunit A
MLQYMDFGSAAADTEAEIQRLRKEGFLNEAEMEALPAEKIKAFLESSLFGRIAASELILREKQLFVKIGELALPEESMLARRYADTEGVLIGTMDLLFRESDGWVLVDYKTDYAHDGSELLDKYSIQLGLYQKAAELIMGEPVKEAYIYSFTLDKALAVDLLHMDYGKISVAAPD